MESDHDLRDFDGVVRLFPLPGVVLFPHVVLPLHVFEPRYRQMTEDALAGDGLVTMVMIRPGHEHEQPGDPPIEPVGCLGRILQHERLPDGRFNFLLLGRRRVRLARELPAAGRLYRRAEAEILDDFDAVDPAGPLRDDLIRLFRSRVESEGRLDPEMATLLESSLPIGVLTDIVAHALGLSATVQQSFLAEADPERRALGLIALLRANPGLGDPKAPAGSREFPPPFSSN